VGIAAMAMLETLVHDETALLAGVAQENRASEAVVGPEAGFPPGHRVLFPNPRIVDYRASVPDLAAHFYALLGDPALRQRLGEAGHARVRELYDYRTVARRFVELVTTKLGLK